MNARRVRDLLELDGIEPAPGIFRRGDMLGSYRIETVLGRGAMGVVYRATDQSIGRTIALKVLSMGGPPAPQIQERFRREGQAAARLQHPNVVRVYDVGQAQGHHFLAMELVDGPTLDDLPPPETPGELRDRLTLIEKTARALDYAHRNGVIHRDVKPANILVDRSDEPHVADFGLARLLDHDQGITHSRATLGTPGYMSPEQIRGESSTVDGRTDVYSLGVMIYEALAGRLPFQGRSSQELFDRILHDEPEAPGRVRAGVPEPLERICLKAMSRDREHRYASAAALADDLANFQSGQPVEARPVPTTLRLTVEMRRRPLVLVGLLGAAVVAAGIWIVISSMRQADRAEKDRLAAILAARTYTARYAEANDAWNRYRRAVEDRSLTGDGLASLLAEATGKARTACAAGPNEANPLALLGDCLKEAGVFEEASRAWESALRIDPHCFAALAGRARASFETFFSQVGRRTIMNDPKAMLETPKHMDQLQKLQLQWRSDLMAARRAPSPDRQRLQVLDALERLGEGDAAAAAQILTECLKLAPGDAEAWYLRGQSRLWLRDLPAALEDFDRALSIRRDSSWHLGRVSALAGLGRVAEGIAECTKSLQLEPDRWDALMNRGTLRKYAKDLAGAEEDLTASLRLNPGYAPSYLNRGSVRRERGDFEGALKDVDESIRIDPAAGGYFNRGNIHQARKDYVNAIRDYTLAIEQTPTLVEAYLMRGWTYTESARLAMSEPAAAAELLTLALKDYEKAAGHPETAKGVKVVKDLLGKLGR